MEKYLNIYHNSFNNEDGVGTAIVITDNEVDAHIILSKNTDKAKYYTPNNWICIIAAISSGNPRFISENSYIK